jgi:hypothetical protein
MLVQFNKTHPALKHAGYSATTLLPGEDPAAFEKLHRDLVADLKPVGPLEEDIVADIARLIWRKQNLATFRIAQLAKQRRRQLNAEKSPTSFVEKLRLAQKQGAQEECYEEKWCPAAEEQARQELGDIYQLIEIGEPATIDGLKSELDIKERLDGLISKKLKQLLMVRGVKSLSLTPSPKATPQISSMSPPQISARQEQADTIAQ